MTVRFRADRGKWLASVTTDTGRISKSFDTEREALGWESSRQSELSQAQQIEQQKQASLREGSLSHLLCICARIDWEGKNQGQHENAARLVKMLGADTHAAEITMQRLDALVLELRGTGASNSTILKYLSAMSVMLLRACRLGYISTMPLFPEKRTLRLPEPRDLVIKDEWLAAMLDELERRDRRSTARLVIFLRHVGCRIGEALDLTWDRVDLSAGWMQFIRTKGGMPRRLPISDEVAKVLRAMQIQGDGSNVFPIGYKIVSKHYREAKDAVCDRLRLSDVVRDEWVIHTLRHTKLTELAREGWQAPAIQQWAGHRSLTVTQRYIHGANINLCDMVRS